MASAWGSSWSNHWGNSWGSIAVTTAAHDGADGAPKWEIDALKRHYHELEDSQRKSKAKRRAAEKALEDALARAFRKVTGEPEPVQAALLEAAKAAGATVRAGQENPLVQLDWASVIADVARLAEIIAAVEAAQRWTDEEDDIETLLLLAA